MVILVRMVAEEVVKEIARGSVLFFVQKTAMENVIIVVTTLVMKDAEKDASRLVMSHVA